ncbi:glycosyltransferase [Silicimonas sp. MF1-12-2]|uniref:glycosyltransferase n=1 Tax=Silicimonas sp. MF1-12-2 TaxID=3384793 RepID=UPI0039B52DB4
MLYIIDRLGRGGAEKLMTVTLPELRRRGVTVELMFFQQVSDSTIRDILEEQGIPLHFAPLDKIRRIDQILSIMGKIRALRPDVIHAHLQFGTIISSFARLLLRIPAVTTIHVMDRFEADAHPSLRDRVVDIGTRRILDRTIFLSPSSLAAARATTGIGRNAIVIPNGIDIAKFSTGSVAQSLRRDCGVGAEGLLLTTVAILRPLKGLEHLVAAMPQIIEASPMTSLAIVGDGPNRASLEEQIVALSLQERVHLLGFRTDIPEILAASDIFVLPTLREAFPTVILEAMASGLPVVASNVGGVPDIVDRDTGILVPTGTPKTLADAICTLLEDTSLRTTLSGNARRKAVTEFSIETQVDRLQALYSELAGRDV